MLLRRQGDRTPFIQLFTACFVMSTQSDVCTEDSFMLLSWVSHQGQDSSSHMTSKISDSLSLLSEWHQQTPDLSLSSLITSSLSHPLHSLNQQFLSLIPNRGPLPLPLLCILTETTLVWTYSHTYPYLQSCTNLFIFLY